ncbi:MAG: hypothetical protein L3K08_02540 [Thermoplasmata archaeon]|jgi:hypothetical protein|nr:hypothetical protein [Thermoplasmata archaeon]
MSIKQRGKSLEQKVVRGTKTVGRDVKRGMSKAGASVKRGAAKLERAGKRAGRSTRAEMTRADLRLRPNHVPKRRGL